MLRTRARLGGEKADDIAYLVDEQRIVRQLERLATVRLQAERHPHPADRGVGKAALAPLLQAYLGHKNIQHTVRRTELAPARFKSGGGNNSVPSFGTCADADADVSAAAIATIAVRDFISPALWRERAAATTETQRRVAGRSPALSFVHGSTRAHSQTPFIESRQQQQEKQAAAPRLRAHHEDRTPTHGYAATCEDAMAAFAKSWRRHLKEKLSNWKARCSGCRRSRS
jgi:hypothetical protein